jgi:hypothetical protein
MEVIGTQEFADWYAKLPEDDACAVTTAISVLESVGPDARHVRVIEVPPALRMQNRVVTPRPVPFVLPHSLRELSVRESPYRVLFAIERDESRIVLLYGYDESVGPGPRQGYPPLAHLFLAATVYSLYKKEVA